MVQKVGNLSSKKLEDLFSLGIVLCLTLFDIVCPHQTSECKRGFDVCLYALVNSFLFKLIQGVFVAFHQFKYPLWEYVCILVQPFSKNVK